MNTAFKNISILLIVLAASIILASCSEETADDDLEGLTRIRITAGDRQTERAGAVLPDPMTVRVTDILGQPKHGIPVFFSTEDPGAAIDPPTEYTDENGYASALFRLGSVAGAQAVGVRSGSDSTTFNHTAEALGCTEENPEGACQWTAGHIFITTTSSSMITRLGSVLIEFDPVTGTTEKVLETDFILRDLDFSSRGELFVTTSEKLYKVDPGTGTLIEYADLPVLTGSEIAPNMGGVLLMASNSDVFAIGCPGGDAVQITQSYLANYENLGVDPVTRDFYISAGSGTTHNIFYNEWDGRGDVNGSMNIELYTGTGAPRGMCVDMEGFLYVTIDGNDNSRSVARIRPGLTEDPKWFDFYAYFGGNNQLAGRWGDITALGDHLYLIDTRMNRLVVLDATGTTDAEKYAAEYPDDVFSLGGSDSERYGIAATPEWIVCVGPG